MRNITLTSELDKETAISYGMKFFHEMNYIPSVTDFKVLEHYPNPVAVRKLFGTWKEYLKECNFPFGHTKKERDTFYLGKHSWFSQDYYIDIRNLYYALHSELKKITDKIEVDIVHNQMVYVFKYNDKNYGTSFLNNYVEDYGRKINIIKEVFEDLDIQLINLNSNYTWWKKQLYKELEVEE